MLLDQGQIGLPHIGANELDFLRQFLAYHGEEFFEAFQCSIRAYRVVTHSH